MMGFLLLAAALVGSFELDSSISKDDFEGVRERDGNPMLVDGVVSKGLLTATKQARYETADVLSVALPKATYTLPESERFFRFAFRLYDFNDSAEISLKFSSGGESVRRRVVTHAHAEKIRAVLPVDVAYVVSSAGECVCTLTSLADGSVTRNGGDDKFFANLAGQSFSAAIELKSIGGKAEMTIDEYEAAIVRRTAGSELIPDFILKPKAEFDPKAEGWKMVFEDEFEGPAGATYDHDKWYFPSWRKHEDFLSLDGQGHLALKCDYAPGETNLVSSALWSKQQWRYGYFESRLRFTKNNGWWSAFWLYGQSNYNAMECGGEIDIFEDYYTRYKSETAKNLGVPLDHNLHISYDKTIKSLNIKSFVPGSVDEFHTIGCLWTPFGVSIYADGKLLKASSNGVYPTVTFDSFNHSMIAVPLHVILSGGIFKGWGPRDLTGFTFPEYFLVDYVRVYEWPGVKRAPKVSWKTRPQGGFVKDGTMLEFEVEVKGSSKAAYLFDNGACIATCTKAPWHFEVPFSKATFAENLFMRPGRQKKPPVWEGRLHSLDVFVQDSKGNVGSTDQRVRLIPAPTTPTTPREGRVQAVPGKIDLARFDEGEKGAAFMAEHDQPVVKNGRLPMLHTGHWLSYGVDVAKDGTYEATLGYSKCSDIDGAVDLLVDGVRVATFDCPAPEKTGVSAKAKVRASLRKGRQTLTIVPYGYQTIDGLEIH